MIISNTFTPFFGFVEDVDDPLENGRVRVRVTGYHTQNKGVLPTDELIWFMCMTKDEADSGVGTNPKYNVGSMVFGYFIDNQLQNGFILGAFNGMPNGENDINRLARNKEIDQTIVQEKRDNVKTGVEKTDGSSWDEPETPYNAKYPNNRVTETNSGHVTESDDTEGAERLHVYHKAGTFYEVHPDGSQVVKIVKDDYTIIAGDGYFCVEGNSNGFIGGNNDLVIKGTNTLDVEGKSTLRAPEIQLGEDSDVEPSVLGDKLAAWITTELVPWLNSHNHIGNLGFPTSPAGTGSLGPFDPGTGAPQGAVYSKKNTNQ